MPYSGVRNRTSSGWYHNNDELIDFFAPLIGAYGIAVYNVLSREAFREPANSRLSERYIGSILGISDTRVRRSLVQLEDLGLIDWQRALPRSPAASSCFTLLDVKEAVRHIRARKKVKRGRTATSDDQLLITYSKGGQRPG